MWERAGRTDAQAAGPDGTWRLSFWCSCDTPSGRTRHPCRHRGGAGRQPRVGLGAGARAVARRPRRGGIEPGDVDTVVLTHLHEDHYGWVVGPTAHRCSATPGTSCSAPRPARLGLSPSQR
ncbi:MBL fold metallo-hydrolase [Streptomyces sp. NPDC014006]|uniref:MBL fold metallo-hydrolase n=1 Tax=Streptomyces sp. NPDC014006 TaxID=3364870 RepID=UPI0036F593A9